ncbi:hypothetical protein ACFLZN_01655 [Nanoarchaeota archaeon]
MTKRKKTDNFPYLTAVRFPTLLVIIHSLISFAITYFAYRDVGVTEVLKMNPIVGIMTLLLLVATIGILLYTGYASVSKYNATMKNTIIVGLIISSLQTVLSYLTVGLSYFVVPFYKALYAPVFVLLQEPIIIVMIFAMILSTIFAIGINTGITAIGGLIAKSRTK